MHAVEAVEHAQPRQGLNDVQAERNVLGAILLHAAIADNNEVLDTISMTLKVEDFWLERHRRIYAGMLEAGEARLVVAEPVLVPYLLDRHRLDLDDVGYLSSLTIDIPTTAIAVPLAQRVRELSRKRSLLEFATDLQEMVTAGSADSAEVLEQRAESLLVERLSDRQPDSIRWFGDSFFDEMERVKYIAKHQANPPGEEVIPTGVADLDAIIGGFSEEQMIIAAARPGMGKTAFGMQVVDSWSLTHQIPVGVFSIEMGEKELRQRVICSRCKVEFEKYKAGLIEPDEYDAIYNMADVVNAGPLWVDYSAKVDTNRLVSVARMWKRRYGIRMIMVDYIQLIKPSRRHKAAYLEIEEISAALRELAKELKITCLVLAQLNRDLEKRGDKRPIPADLRGSGSLEQDAHKILFLYRESVYMTDEQKRTASDSRLNSAEIIVAKNRGGRSGLTAHTVYLGPYMRFESVAPEYRTP